MCVFTSFLLYCFDFTNAMTSSAVWTRSPLSVSWPKISIILSAGCPSLIGRIRVRTKMKTGRGTEWPSFCSGICSCNLKYLGEDWLGFDHVTTVPDKPAVSFCEIVIQMFWNMFLCKSNNDIPSIILYTSFNFLKHCIDHFNSVLFFVYHHSVQCSLIFKRYE